MYDERLAALEQTVASLRNDFLQAIIENTHSMSTLNKVFLQQELNARDANHEIAKLVGVISAQGKDIQDIKNHIEGFDQRFTSLDQRMESFDQRFTSLDQRMESFDQRFASLDGKLEQVLQILTTLPGTDK